MNKKIVLILITIFIINTSFSQKWTYSSGGNVFDGKYKICSVEGTGGEYPYNEPRFVVNYFENDNHLNVYLNKAGYAGCDNKKVYIKFDKDSNLYTFSVSTNSAKDVWFLYEISTSILKLLEKMKEHNKIYVRLSSDCGQSDFEFSLLGSSVAINYVISDYISNIKQIKKNKKRMDDMISSGDTLKAKVTSFVNVLYSPSFSAFYKELMLTKGEEIIFSNYSENSKFYILHKASTIELVSDSTFYIRKSGINIKTVESIND